MFTGLLADMRSRRNLCTNRLVHPTHRRLRASFPGRCKFLLLTHLLTGSLSDHTARATMGSHHRIAVGRDVTSPRARTHPTSPQNPPTTAHVQPRIASGAPGAQLHRTTRSAIKKKTKTKRVNTQQQSHGPADLRPITQPHSYPHPPEKTKHKKKKKKTQTKKNNKNQTPHT